MSLKDHIAKEFLRADGTPLPTFWRWSALPMVLTYETSLYTHPKLPDGSTSNCSARMSVCPHSFTSSLESRFMRNACACRWRYCM